MPSTDVNVSKFGTLTGANAEEFAALVDVSSATVSMAQTNSTVSAATQYFRSSGRGGGTFRVIRTYLGFDVSGISGTVTAADLKIQGTTSTNFNGVRIVKCHASTFGTFNNGFPDNLGADAWSKVDFNTDYSDEITSWNAGSGGDSGGVNTITLNGDARTQIQNYDMFICAVVDEAADFQVFANDNDVDPLSADGDYSTAIIFDASGKIKLTVTTAASGYGNQVLDVASANIQSVIEVATNDIANVIGVS